MVFLNRQTYAYRFIHCVLEGEIAGRDQVVRHRCHNRLCVNLRHLALGHAGKSTTSGCGEKEVLALGIRRDMIEMVTYDFVDWDAIVR